MAGSTTILLQDSFGIHDITPFVKRFVYYSSLISGYVRWKLTFNTNQWDDWKDLMIGNGLLFSIRISGERDGLSTESDWLTLVTDNSDGNLRSTQLNGVIEGGGVELQMMEQTKRKVYASMTASAAVRQIAAAYDLVPDISDTSEISTWYQANQTDWEMLQELMERYVPSSDNRGDTYLHVEGKTLSIKSINFAAPSTRQYDLSGDDDRVYKVRYKYYGGQVTRKGVAVEAVGFDRDLGLPITHTVSPTLTGTAVLADKMPVAVLAQKKTIVVASGNLEVARNWATREQAKYSRRYFGVSVSALNDLTIRLRDMMEISAKDSEGSGAFTEGRYGIFEYRYAYSPAGINTTIVGYRQESYEGPQVAVGAPVSTSMGTDTYRASGSEFQPTMKTAQVLGV